LARHVAEKCTERRKPVIAHRSAVAPVCLEMVQEACGQFLVEVLQDQLVNRLFYLLRSKAEKELKRIPVTKNGIATEPLLRGQILLEEPLHKTSKLMSGVHIPSPFGEMF